MGLGFLQFVFFVHLSVPPSVNIVPEKSPQSFEAGSHIQLTCYPSGNPLPTIVWTRLVCTYKLRRVVEKNN